jgi:hypothetical protein
MRYTDLQRRFRPRTTGRRRSTRATRIGVWTAVVVAGLLAVSADASPTGTEWIDAAYRFAAAGGLAYATSYARRWSWVYLALLTSVVTLGDPLLLALALVSMVIAIVGYSAMDRERAMGALVGGACAQVLLRLPDFGFLGSATLVALAICAPVLVSAWYAAPRRVKYKVGTGLGILVAFGALASLGAAAGAVSAKSSVELGIEYAEAGLDSLVDGEQEKAQEQLQRASEEFKKANDAATAPWAIGGTAIPIVGHQSKAVIELTDAALELTETASAASQMIDIDALRLEGGRINTNLVVSMNEPLGAVVDSLDSTQATLIEIDSPWLLTPLADRIERVSTEIEEALPTAHDLADTLALAPSLLGVDEPQTYLVLFTTPSEQRGLGGFVGAFAELRLDDGNLELVRTGRPAELNQVLRANEAVLKGPQEYLDRWGRWLPQEHFQDVTFSPDFPSVAEVSAGLYPQGGGSPVDGVISLDPSVLAGLLEFTGPVEVGETRLTSENAEQFLLFDQYVEFEDEDPERQDQLDVALREMFTQLVESDVPSPRVVKEVLGPLVDQDRLNLHSQDTETQALYERFGMAGEFPRDDGGDFLAIANQNAVNNKIDYFLERELRYEVDYDPVSGRVEARLEVELFNGAPDEGLPSSIIGANDRVIPDGTNIVNFSIYTPHDLMLASLDGQPVTMAAGQEFGYNTYEMTLTMPAGSRGTLLMRLNGRVDPGPTYRLGYSPQPVVGADTLKVKLEAPDSWQPAVGEGFEPTDEGFELDETPTEDVVFTARFTKD